MDLRRLLSSTPRVRHGGTPPRRLLLLAAIAAVLGLAGGGAAYVLLHLIGFITNLALFHRIAWSLPTFRDVVFGPGLLFAAVGGALIVSLLALWSPVIRGHGIPEAMEAILTKQSRIQPRAAIAKPLSAAIAIGTGGPFGAEGPIIVTGGALGSLIGQVIPVSPAERKILLASGAAAGMAATFGAPLASVMLAIELLLFEFSTRAFVPLVVASSIAAGIHFALFGSGPLFAVPSHSYAGLDKLPLYALLGLACGVLAVVIVRGLSLIERGYRRLPVSEFWHPVIGAVLFALIGLGVPRAMGVGYPAISDVLATKLALGSLIVLGLGKLGAWWFALASGTSGGTLAPILLIGGSFGSILGILFQRAMPGAHISPGAFALVAMAATFGAATRATFTSIVFLFELTQDYRIILPLMLASVIADLVSAWLLPDTIMTEKLTRRGLRVHAEFEVDLLRTTAVDEVMTREVRTIPASAPVGEARAVAATGGHGAYPVVDEEGRCVGIVGRGDVLLAEAPEDSPLAEVDAGDVVAVSPDTSVLEALHRMLEESVEHLPVLDDDGRLVGICTRTDILRVREQQLRHERLEPGWRPRRRQATTETAPSPSAVEPIGPVELEPQGGDGQADHSPSRAERA
jgi:CIC family chloride channel protein